MKPILSKRGQSAQLRYELPHRVHDAKVYPVRAPNGSTIVIYGHETGVRILWRGGRLLKEASTSKPQSAKPRKVNGTSTDVIMLDDSDDNQQPAQSTSQQLEEAEFESEDEEIDPAQPYPSFVQYIDLALHTEVLQIAIPQVPATSTIRTADSMPGIFSKRIVFTASCVDYGVRVVTLPLGPPSVATKNKAKWGEQIVKITSHQSIPRGISMTWTSRSEPTFEEEPEEEEEVMEVEEDDVAATPRRRRARRQQSRSRSGRREAKGWDILIASHSEELGGLLRIWRLPIGTKKSDDSIDASNLAPYQLQYLRTPASKIAFNTAQHPKRRHSQLLIADSTGLVKIYDPFAAPSRRGGSSRGEIGTFTASFRSTFEPQKDNISALPNLAHRKSILDVCWALDGRNVIALLADGEWGLWDIERSGSKPPVDPSSFSLRGFVGVASQSTQSTSTTSPKARSSRGSGALAPMTPNTRRVKEDSLFQGSSVSPSGPPRGGISLVSFLPKPGEAPQDTVIIWYGNEAYRIPHLNQYWSRSATSGSGSLNGPRLTAVQGLALYGETISSIDQFETSLREARNAIPREVLVAAEHRLLIITTAKTGSGRDLTGIFDRERVEEEEARRTDQALLARGELDIGGMDRLLDEMDDGNDHGQQGLVNPRRVLFASSTN